MTITISAGADAAAFTLAGGALAFASPPSELGCAGYIGLTKQLKLAWQMLRRVWKGFRS